MAKRGPNVGQILMAKHLTEMGLVFNEQIPVCQGRRWTWDFFLPGARVAIEVDGMYRGAHGVGWGQDYEKQNYGIMVQGIRVIRFTAREVERGKAREYLESWFCKWEPDAKTSSNKVFPARVPEAD